MKQRKLKINKEYLLDENTHTEGLFNFIVVRSECFQTYYLKFPLDLLSHYHMSKSAQGNERTSSRVKEVLMMISCYRYDSS